MKLLAELRKKFEALLTPEQLESYREMAFRSIADSALLDPVVQNEIGMSIEQCGSLQRLFQDSIEKYRKNGREMGEAVLNVLTPQQQEKLQKVFEEMQKQAYSNVDFSADSSGVVNGVGSVTVTGDVGDSGAEAGVGSVTITDNVIEMKGKLNEGKGTITMQATMDIEGIVLSPDGTPAAGAAVAYCTKSNEVTVKYGKLHWQRDNKELKLAETAKDGSFRLNMDAGLGMIIAANDQGYAEITVADFLNNSSKVQLKPWGRVEGEFVIDGKPVAGYQIGIAAGRKEADVNLSFYDHTTTNGAGNFTLEQVPPVNLYIAPYFPSGDSSYSVLRFTRQTSIAPGKTTQVKMPRGGRPVIGRVVLPPDSKLRLADLTIEAKITLRPPSISGDIGSVDKSWAAYSDFMKQFGDFFRRDKINVKADGTFRIEGLPETDYVISVKATGESLKTGAFAPAAWPSRP